MKNEVRALWQELRVTTKGADNQVPALTKLSAATITGLDVAIVQLELGRRGVECSGHGADANGIPFVEVQHMDDTQHVWETYVEFPDMKGYAVWAVAVYTDHMKIAFTKGN
jgi:hypothetical protein